MQLVFQDPISSLNPRRKVGDIVAEPLRIWGIGTDAEQHGARSTRCSRPSASTPTVAGRKRPHQFSGGQCQRISIARALVLDPKLIICDEPVSALDVSVQAQILNLLEDMKARYGLTLVFIAHDLAVVKNVSDRVAVMYLGKLCEVAHPDELYTPAGAPVHRRAALGRSRCPTRTCPGDRASSSPGDPPSPIDPPSGCRFRTRCPRATERCAEEEPQLRPVLRARRQHDHVVACHHPLVEAVPRSTRRRRGRRRVEPRHDREGGRAQHAANADRRPVTRLDPAVRRTQIVEAAAAAVRGPRPAEVTFEEIADAAGVSRALVYNYFGDRGGLLAAVYLHHFDAVNERLRAAAPPAHDPERAACGRPCGPTSTSPPRTPGRGGCCASPGPSTTRRWSQAREQRMREIAAAWGGSAEARIVAYARGRAARGGDRRLAAIGRRRAGSSAPPTSCSTSCGEACRASTTTASSAAGSTSSRSLRWAAPHGRPTSAGVAGEVDLGVRRPGRRPTAAARSVRR